MGGAKRHRAMRIAYLVNQYPKVSHTFIRREILALEAAGAEVSRFAVRRVSETLTDPVDEAELARTRVLLDAGPHGLAAALAACARSRPAAFARAARLALKVGHRSDRGQARHIAYLAEACLLLCWLESSGVQHVHAHFGTNSATVAMLCRELGGPPYSFTVHGPEEFDKATVLGLREKIERAAFVVPISSYGRSQLYRCCDHSQWPKMYIVHCGLDAQFLEGEPAPLVSKTRLVSVGRLSEQKGQLLLLEAVAELMRRGFDFELVLVGDGELREEMEARIAALGLAARVKITGWASSAEVRAYLESGRALVLPSFAKGLPVVLMEALALGRPVLTTYVAGIPELVSQGPDGCGWLVPSGSVEDLVDGMQRVLETPDDQLAAMGREGQRRVRLAHDASIEARKLLAAIQRHSGRAPVP